VKNSRQRSVASRQALLAGEYLSRQSRDREQRVPVRFLFDPTGDLLADADARGSERSDIFQMAVTGD
jgi:hypothetical protein